MSSPLNDLFFLSNLPAYDPCKLRIHNITLNYERTDLGSGNGASGRIEYTVDPCGDLGVYVPVIFKSQSCVDHPAVYHGQIVNIAQSLKALDGTVFKGQVFRISPQILAADIGILHYRIACIPESIL